LSSRAIASVYKLIASSFLPVEKAAFALFLSSSTFRNTSRLFVNKKIILLGMP
jgi:hypothetical protein